MKTRRIFCRFLGLLLCCAMVLTMGVTAFAVTEEKQIPQPYAVDMDGIIQQLADGNGDPVPLENKEDALLSVKNKRRNVET